jgi:hypothetical protein
MKPNTTTTKRRKSNAQKTIRGRQLPSGLLWLLLLVAMAGTFHEYIIERGDGSYELSPERQAKLDKELEGLDEAVQYALIAEEDGYYECYNCGIDKSIFLKKGEVWKYGYTTMERRYAYTYLSRMKLTFVPQYSGSLGECAKEEKRKIYHYPMLPENLVRSFRLPRPPGNKQDN